MVGVAMIDFEPRELRHSMMLHQVPVIRDQAPGCRDGTGKSHEFQHAQIRRCIRV